MPVNKQLKSNSPGRKSLWLGCLVLILAVGGALLLSLGHVDAVALPGCGGQSDCARAARSAWATFPIGHVPVAFLALGYEVGTLVFWLGMGGRLRGVARWVVWVGALGSCVYVAVSISERLFCPYCFGVHACNLVMLGISEWSRRGGRVSGGGIGRIAALAAAAGVLAMLPLFVAQGSAKAKIEDSLAKSTEAIKQSTKRDSHEQATVAVQGESIQAEKSEEKPQEATPSVGPVFTGRYRLGPEIAQVRVVIFTDYECPDCKRLEAEIVAKVRADSRFSVSVKQFPLSTGCNHYVDQDMHPDACWAARAAEVAGILGGNDAFWNMSEWLFAHNGSFDEPTLRAAVASFGFDADQFVSMLESPDVSSRISADIEEAASLGILGTATPMIFINGVELRGWSAPDAFERATSALLATNPPARSARDDRPPPAREKYILDWSSGPVFPISDSSIRHRTGPKDAKVHVVVFGDYLEPNTIEADRALRQLAADPAKSVEYTFLHFPFDQECNPGVPMTKHAGACAAARLAEAAGSIGGEDAFWKAHAWFAADTAKSQQLLTQGLATGELAKYSGVEAVALLDASGSAGVVSMVQGDCALGKSIGLTQLPWILVNGKVVRQWRFGSENLLSSIVDAARGK